MKQQLASTTTRNDLVAMRLRIACRAIFNFVHKLKLQFMDEDPSYVMNGERFVLPREVLAMDYQLDISGSSDPLDASARRQENLGLFQLLMGIPFIAQDQIKTFNVVRMVLEGFDRADVVQLIGTDQEAQQRQQAQMEAQQKQQQLQAATQLLGALSGQKPHQQQKPQQKQGNPQQGAKPHP